MYETAQWIGRQGNSYLSEKVPDTHKLYNVFLRVKIYNQLFDIIVFVFSFGTALTAPKTSTASAGTIALHAR